MMRWSWNSKNASVIRTIKWKDKKSFINQKPLYCETTNYWLRTLKGGNWASWVGFGRVDSGFSFIWIIPNPPKCNLGWFGLGHIGSTQTHNPNMTQYIILYILTHNILSHTFIYIKWFFLIHKYCFTYINMFSHTKTLLHIQTYIQLLISLDGNTLFSFTQTY